MSDLHRETFDYLKPSKEQTAAMFELRRAARAYAMQLERYVPDGPDKTYLLRKLREVAMWANVAITRLPDGTPRQEREPLDDEVMCGGR